MTDSRSRQRQRDDPHLDPIADPGRLIGPDRLWTSKPAAGQLPLSGQGNVPMFPNNLSTGVFSLRAGQRTAAWST